MMCASIEYNYGNMENILSYLPVDKGAGDGGQGMGDGRWEMGDGRWGTGDGN